VRGPGGIQRVLIGIAVSTSERTPVEAMRTATRAELEAVTADWAGRWRLIDGHSLHGDAGGVLGVFTTIGISGALWASSSVALTIRASGREATVVSRDLKHGTYAKHFGWYPLPGSRFEGVRSILPGEVFDLVSGERSYRTRISAEARQNVDDLIGGLAEYLVGVIRKVSFGAPRVWLPLTAGYDSRLLLAACNRAGIEVTTVTQRKTNMETADANLPPKLASISGYEHQWIPVAEEDPQLLRSYDAHTGGHINDIDRSYFARSQLQWAGPEDVILRGGVFEVGRCHYWRHLDAKIPSLEQIAQTMDGENDPGMLTSIAEWLKHCHDHPLPGIDWRDRFYLEQRVGGWLSAVEQSLDLVPGTRFYAANSAIFYCRVLSLPASLRAESWHHLEIIRCLSPELLQFPFN